MSYPPGGYGGPGGYPDPGHPQQAYGGYGGYGGQVEHPQGNTVLILGILGLVVCGICAPFAWSMGNRVLQEIDRDPLRYSNRSNVATGRILGIAGTVILGVSLVAGILYVIFIIAVIGGTASTS